MREKQRSENEWGLDAFSISFGIFILVVGFIGLAGLMGAF